MESAGFVSSCTVEDKWKQRAWDHLHSVSTFNSLLEQPDKFSRCHLLSTSVKFLEDWIEVLHVANNGGLFSLDELCISITVRVEADICKGQQCHCGKPVVPILHGIFCCLNDGCFACHTELNLIIKWAPAQMDIPLSSRGVGVIQK